MLSVVETKFHLLQIQQKVMPRDAIVAFQFGLGIAPEVLDPSDVAPAARGEAVALMDPNVSVLLCDQAIVPRELVRIDRGALGHLLPDHGPEGLARDIGHGPGVHLATPLQQPKHGDFAGGRSASLSLPVSPEVGLIRFDLTAQGRDPFTLPGEVAANDLIDPLGAVPIDPQHAGRFHRWHFQRKGGNGSADLPVREFAPRN